MTDRSEGYHAALASASRRQILDVLRTSAEPLDAAAVADRLGLHVTTARFHLDQLSTAGLVERSAGAQRRRGRPRVLYATAGSVREEDAREQLIQVLAAALALTKNPDTDASAAGRRWGEAFTAPDPKHPMPGLVAAMKRLGFDPEPAIGPDSDSATILLHACPFRGAARGYPDVICAIHRGLIEALLEDAAAHAALIPFVEPELCVVTLNRRQSPPASA